MRALARMAGRAVDSCLDMTRSFGFGPVEECDFTDTYGFCFHVSPRDKTQWIVSRPFDDGRGAAEFLKHWIGDVTAETKRIQSEARAVGEAFRRRFLGEQALMGDTVCLLTEQGVGLDTVRHRLGLELFAYLEVEDPGLLSEALEAETQQKLAICHAIADRSLSSAVLIYGDAVFGESSPGGAESAVRRAGHSDARDQVADLVAADLGAEADDATDALVTQHGRQRPDPWEVAGHVLLDFGGGTRP
jgi:hypothetical protein